MAKNNQEEVNKQHIVRQVDFNSDDNDSEIDEMLNDLRYRSFELTWF